MSQRKPVSNRLKTALNELDSAIEQWDSLTNKPEGEQVTSHEKVQRKAKSLLKELRDQIDDFDNLSPAEKNTNATEKFSDQ
jgi:ElaB/YqjD/DUF883 family membrane-anchored ribosome-binding protein